MSAPTACRCQFPEPHETLKGLCRCGGFWPAFSEPPRFPTAEELKRPTTEIKREEPQVTTTIEGRTT